MKYLIVPALFLLGVGCAGISPKPELVTQQTAQEPIPVQESIDMITYATSGKIQLLFDAPIGWFVRQADAGGASTVVIRESKDNDDQTTLSIRQPWPDDDGIQDSYEEWLSEEELSDSVRQKEIGSLTFDVWRLAAGSVTVYTVILDQEAPYYVLIEVPDGHASIAPLFLESIILFPTQAEIESANRIPDWTVEDSR